MSAKQKILHGRGPSNLNLGILFTPLMFAGLPNHSPVLTMLKVSYGIRHYGQNYF